MVTALLFVICGRSHGQRDWVGTVNFNGQCPCQKGMPKQSCTLSNYFIPKWKVKETSMESNQHSLLFDSLPDEMLLKIVKMASEDEHPLGWSKYDHTFIVGTISRISARFSRMAKDRSLWKGNVVLCSRSDLSEGPKHQEIIPRAIECFLGEGVKRLKIVEFHEVCNRKLSLSGDQIKAIAKKCPDLTYLTLRNVGVDSWPFGTIFSLGTLVVDKGVWSWKLRW